MKIIKINPKNLNEAPRANAIKQAVLVIKRGGIIAYPTDTCYGLGANPKNLRAMKRLYLIKGRPQDKKISLIFKDLAMIQEHCRVSPKQKRYLMKFLPGPYTFILKSKKEGDTIAVRIPKHRTTRLLSEYLDSPYTTTSANKSGQPPCYDARCIAQLKDIDLILDAGPLKKNPPSKIVDLTNKLYKVIRS